ncbi:MAG: ABC transporter ATP-binding protein, partial [Oscillospiraceae bacterium]|nr:ABC transporter ATP-binding protein [Oscillospiraceae bacterium]
RTLARTLDGMGLDYKILSQTQAEVFARVNVSGLAAALGAEGCEILSMQERDESLESYYLALVGGAGHE